MNTLADKAIAQSLLAQMYGSDVEKGSYVYALPGFENKVRFIAAPSKGEDETWLVFAQVAHGDSWVTLTSVTYDKISYHPMAFKGDAIAAIAECQERARKASATIINVFNGGRCHG